MSGATSAVLAVAGIAATAYSAQQSEKAASAQKKAQRQAEAAAQAQATQADKEFNAANKKTPDIASMLAGNQRDAMGGASSTMLTGPSGVDAKSLTLGKSTLLGG